MVYNAYKHLGDKLIDIVISSNLSDKDNILKMLKNLFLTKDDGLKLSLKENGLQVYSIEELQNKILEIYKNEKFEISFKKIELDSNIDILNKIENMKNPITFVTRLKIKEKVLNKEINNGTELINYLNSEKKYMYGIYNEFLKEYENIKISYSKYEYDLLPKIESITKDLIELNMQKLNYEKLSEQHENIIMQYKLKNPTVTELQSEYKLLKEKSKTILFKAITFLFKFDFANVRKCFFEFVSNKNEIIKKLDNITNMKVDLAEKVELKKEEQDIISKKILTNSLISKLEIKVNTELSKIGDLKLIETINDYIDTFDNNDNKLHNQEESVDRNEI